MYLHSIIFILKHKDGVISNNFSFSFTFYNIYIKTEIKNITLLNVSQFTFYNIYIKTKIIMVKNFFI